MFHLAVGNNIYQKICDDHEKERNSAVTDLEHRLQTQANEDKQRALKEAKENAEEEMEKAMAAAKKAQVGTNKKTVLSAYKSGALKDRGSQRPSAFQGCDLRVRFVRAYNIFFPQHFSLMLGVRAISTVFLIFFVLFFRRKR